MEKTKGPSGGDWWNDSRVRARGYQILLLAGILLLAYFLFHNVQENLKRQNIASGFGFLGQEASFEVGEALFSYSSADSYARALMVGLANTLKVAVISMFLAVGLGTMVGIARVSHNFSLALLARGYVEIVRNVPLLLQLFFWYSLFSEKLSGVREALQPLPGWFLSNRGLSFPILHTHPAYTRMGVALVVFLVVGLFLKSWARRKQEKTGEVVPWVRIYIPGVLIFLALLWGASGAPWLWNRPVLEGFNFEGGLSLSPEFLSLTIGLTLYTGAFVAEIVRSGIEAISKGQVEAALSLGLPRLLVLRLVVLPQALRVMIPPLTGQLLNLTKNSSLAVAIGYPDFVSVANTSMNQTGQAIECVALIMGVYLTLSLSMSFFMNWYNSRVQLIER